MAEQVYWDDVQEGTELPSLVKNPTTQQLVKYAGASGDYYQIHYDKDFAKNNDLENVILHGALKNAFLGHLVTKKYQEQGANLVDCDIWLENEKGEKTTPGSATVALPVR